MMFLQFLPMVLVVSLGLLIVHLLFSRQRSDYKQQVARMQDKKPAWVKPEFKIYTREEVAKHSSRHDAWVIIKHKASGEQRVYDLTHYIDEHPGGDSILNNAGADSTEGFHGPQHPDTVFIMVEEYCIGKLQD